MSVPEIQDFLGVDSLSYLSLDRLIRATGHADAGFCTGCFSGNYPVDIQLVEKETFER
jgi:amidophosphoribosyltransferase